MVKCADCGFLTARSHEQNTFVEVGEEARGTVENTYAIDLIKGKCQFPICFERAWPLKEESGRSAPKEIQSVLHKERECPQFAKWQQGFSPKEHAEMIHQQALLDWQRKVEMEDKEWREKVRKDDLEWKQKQEATSRSQWETSRSQWAWQFVVVGIIATIVLAATQIIAAVIPFLARQELISATQP